MSHEIIPGPTETSLVRRLCLLDRALKSPDVELWQKLAALGQLADDLPNIIAALRHRPQASEGAEEEEEEMRWTKAPPSEPGWWWIQWANLPAPTPVCIGFDKQGILRTRKTMKTGAHSQGARVNEIRNVLWWPVPIEPPHPIAEQGERGDEE